MLKACTLEALSDQVLVAAISYAGLRPCELVQLEGRDIRMKQDLITCRSGMRVIPMHPTLKEVLLRYRREFPQPPYRPLLPGPNGFPVNTRTLHARFRRLMTRIGLPDVCPESLRRDTAARLRAMGAPPGLVRAFLGKDQGRACAPRRGQHNDLTSLRQRLFRVPGLPVEEPPQKEERNLLL
ncbi:MAG TPA: tyrosine-type recombinase/integrase [Planctomycetota bacterium]|nr:tyrosine-type recombinase/integrase [Planctomycetota bacterium]